MDGITQGSVKRVEMLLRGQRRQSRKAHTAEYGSASGFLCWVFWTVITELFDDIEGLLEIIDALLVCGVVKGEG